MKHLTALYNKNKPRREIYLGALELCGCENCESKREYRFIQGPLHRGQGVYKQAENVYSLIKSLRCQYV